MKTETCDVVVGCSVNPSIVWTSVPNLNAGEKIAANYYVEPSGTSLDVALAVQRAGFQSHLVGAVGPSTDPFNGYLASSIARHGVATTLLPLRSQNALANVEPEHSRALSAKPPIQPFEVNVVRAELDAIVADVRIATGVMPDEGDLELARLLLGKSAKVRVLNPRLQLLADKRLFIPMLQYANWLVMNRHEAKEWECGHFRVEHLVDSYGSTGRVVVVTNDEDGVELWTPDEHISIPAFQAGPTVHTVGAGDCFLGYLVAARIEKLSWPDALRLATVAAGIKTTMAGTTSSPTREVVNARLHEFQACAHVRRR